ncbi:MAG: type VI secretion system baseplate subunit TssE [bacterium]
MYKARTLLERLNNPQLDRYQNSSQNLEALAESVLNHLKKMLNTRVGNSLTQPQDYGMIDLNEIRMNMPDSITNVQNNIKNMIEKYEPRLKNVKIEHINSGDDLMILKFKVIADIAAERRTSIAFETIVEPSGQIQLSG